MECSQRVVIVGGGLAGMAAAVALESVGCTVALLEARQTLGGRAGSFQSPQTGEILDNCQHVLLGCCTNLIDFYRRIGVLDRIEWQKTIRFIDARSRWHSLWGMPGLPAPLNLGPAQAVFGALSLRQRLQLSRAMLAMLRLGVQGRDKLADQSFGQWLTEHHQGDDLINQFYELVLVSALNEKCRDASAKYAIQVFQEGLLAHSAAYRMGMPACPLGELYVKLPCRDVRTGTRMTGLRFEDSRIVGVETATEFLPADSVVLAISHHVVEKWIPPALAARDTRFAGISQLQSVPILGAHLSFDRPVLNYPHAALMSGPLQWVFRKSDDGQTVHGVISAARDWLDRPREECLNIFEHQIRTIFPTAKNAKLIRGTIIIEKRATFSPLPGVDNLRPAQAPPVHGIEGLFLAGDYTLTGWPGTMEGAARSGYLAAEAIIGQPGRFLIPPLPLQWPARWLCQ